MQYSNLGRSGLKVSRICLGMLTFGTSQWRPWVLDEDAARPIVHRAVDLGINYFDTADTYSAGMSETLTGKFVKEFFSGSRRDEVIVATKVHEPVDMAYKGKKATPSFRMRPNLHGLSRKRIFHAIDNSLKRLGLEYIDLYQIHRFDPETPIEETLEALHDLVKAGKIRYVGASSMWTWQFCKAQQIAKENGWTKFISMQNHYNLLYREEEREMIPYCTDSGVAVLPYSPLARGCLAGKMMKSSSASERRKSDVITEMFYQNNSSQYIIKQLTSVAEQMQVNNATLALAWLFHKGVTAPVVGISRIEELDDAVRALDVHPSIEQILSLESGYEPRVVLGHA